MGEVVLEGAVVVEFPLRGEWSAPHTPGTSVPSHGTDQLGQRYAYDFLQVDRKRKGMPFFQASKLRYFLFGVPLKKCYGWGASVHAPCDGRIIEAQDGWKERSIVHVVSDLFVVLKNAFAFDPAKAGLQPVVGNYIIMECAHRVFAFFAHLSEGSIAVSVGEEVKQGQMIGRVGHSGNSTAPHLHFQLMDSSDLLRAQGIPCVFQSYEVLRSGTWQTVTHGVPMASDSIRFV